MFLLEATKGTLQVLESEAPLVSGARELYVCQFRFSQDWEGLTRTVVFKGGGVSRSVLLDGQNQCHIPWEVLALPSAQLKCGVYGTNSGNLVIPTVYAGLGRILKGTRPAEAARQPSPTVYAQLLQTVKNAQLTAQSLREDADAGKFDGSDGKSAYQYALEGGYAGTEADFTEKLAGEAQITVDSELSDTSTNPVQNKAVKTAIDAIVTGQGTGYFLTTYTKNDDGTVAYDHTYAEQLAAWEAGKVLLAKYGSLLLRYTERSAVPTSLVYTLTYLEDGAVNYIYIQHRKSGNTVVIKNETYNYATEDDIPSGGSGNSFVVTCVPDDTATAVTADKTVSEQLEALVAGTIPVVKLDLGIGVPIVLQYVSSINFTGGDTLEITYTATMFYEEFTLAVKLVFFQDGTNALVISEQVTPTPDNIDAMIDEKLGVIENGTY